VTRLAASRERASEIARLSAESLWRGFLGFYHSDNLTYAASIAYYSLLSLFPLTMLAVSGLLAGWGIARLRVWNPSGEPVMQRERPEDEDVDRSRAHAAPNG